MHGAGIRPNVRTYTALVAALGRGGQWDRARRLLGDMRRGCPWGGAEPNAYTYSALLKCMGDQVRIGALHPSQSGFVKLCTYGFIEEACLALL